MEKWVPSRPACGGGSPPHSYRLSLSQPKGRLACAMRQQAQQKSEYKLVGVRRAQAAVQRLGDA
ncbi:hypothetical protein E2562_035757 [Oryza meyeriana var. granulata]|uniref:Uncharacterized protein n=1 Tax=Oryza meyeriana var. granulata TaxID=110450 RepID=A0A6G1FFQ0_9ORYZ|nr:hypothetical protein E2562_035757 [Oryza meyeriana var. granulata]